MAKHTLAPGQLSLPLSPPPAPAITVSQLNQYVAGLLQKDARLHSLRVEGEVSGLKKHTSGHWYFTLKDEGAAVRCTMFRERATKVQEDIKEGMAVVVEGYAALYVQGGIYQLYAQRLFPQGRGELYAAFERLKEQLRQLGWLEESAKKPLPAFAQAVGVVTSATGAALQDILRVAARRNAATRIVVCPARVQGEGAAQEVANAIRRLQRYPGLDLLIVGRGGGSIEDLWAFNEQEVAAAIHECSLPVICAVGHETDFTIADFVADVRAATPSMAAELAVPSAQEWGERLGSLAATVKVALSRLLDERRQRMDQALLRLQHQTPLHMAREQYARIRQARTHCRTGLVACLQAGKGRLWQAGMRLNRCSPVRYAAAQQLRLQSAGDALRATLTARLSGEQQRVRRAKAVLDSLSPLRVLERGYALTLDEAGNVVTSAKALRLGQTLRVVYSDSSATAQVADTALDAPPPCGRKNSHI